MVAPILDLCIEDFDKNIYVVDTRMRAAQERTNILQEEDDEILSLGMPMQPQEEGNEEQKDEENDKLEEEESEAPPPSSIYEAPPPPSTYEVENQTQTFINDDICVDNIPCFYDSDDDKEDQPMFNENIIDNNFISYLIIYYLYLFYFMCCVVLQATKYRYFSPGHNFLIIFTIYCKIVCTL